MIRLDILRRKGFKITYYRDKISATRYNKTYEAVNLTKLFNNVKDNIFIVEKQNDNTLSDPHNLEQFFNKQNS